MSENLKQCAVVLLTCVVSTDEDELQSQHISHSVLLHCLKAALQGVCFNGVHMENTISDTRVAEECVTDKKVMSNVYLATQEWVFDGLVHFSVKLKLKRPCRSKTIVAVIDDDCQVVLDSRWNSLIFSPYASSSPTSSLLYDSDLQNSEVVHDFQKIASKTLGGSNEFGSQSPCASVLLIGPTGSGKTSLVLHHAVKMYPYSSVINIRSGEVMARCYEENAASPVDILLEAFKTAFITIPSIVVFDDLDRLIYQDSSSDPSDDIIKIICQFLQVVASLKNTTQQQEDGNCGMLVIGCVESPSTVGKFVKERFDIQLTIPNLIAKERRKIIKKLYEKYSFEKYQRQNFENFKIKDTHEQSLYSYADAISNMSLGAFIYAANDCVMKLIDLDQDAFENSENVMKKKAFTEICGHEKEKQDIYELIAWPRVYTDLYKLFNVKPIIGILLYGPPGTGKTLLAKVCAQELGCSFVNVRIPDVIRGHIGTGEQKLRDLFMEAKLSAPCIIFIDEFQSIFTIRNDHGSIGSGNHGGDKTGSSLSSTLASCFDDLSIWNEHAGIESMVTVIAATNEPWAIDRSFLRSGRLEKSVYIGTLDQMGRKEMIMAQLIKIEMGQVDQESKEDKEEDVVDDDIKALIAHTANFTGADMKYLWKKALMELINYDDMHNESTVISRKRFLSTCLSLVIKKQLKPSQVSEEKKKMYRNWH